MERRLKLKSVTAGIEVQWIQPDVVAIPFTMPEPLTVEDRVEHRYYLYCPGVPGAEPGLPTMSTTPTFRLLPASPARSVH